MTIPTMKVSDEEAPVRQKPLERTPETAPHGDAPIPSGIPARHQVTSGLFRFSVTQFLVLLILVLVAKPFLSQFHRGEVIVSASMTVVLISAVLAVGGGGRLLVFTILLVLPALGAE